MISIPLLSAEYLDMATEQEAAERDLLAMPNVVGVALGPKLKGGEPTKEKAVQVFVNQKLPLELLPKGAMVGPAVGPYVTDVIEVGEVFAQNDVTVATERRARRVEGTIELDVLGEPAFLGRTPAPEPLLPVAAPQVLRQRIRPAMGGFSVGHPKVTAGTIATCCYDASAFPGIPQRYYILSNNHVLANSNNASIGDPVLQPGTYDGGTLPSDVIGRLTRFVPIRFHAPPIIPINYVDAAIAEVQFHEATREVYWIGYLSKGVATVVPGNVVQKTGRTTNFTTGKVISVNATIDVSYGSGKVARFGRQIVTTAMSAGGDSGSLVTNLEEQAVGLLFAGSATHTIMNPIAMVQSLLNVRITEA